MESRHPHDPMVIRLGQREQQPAAATTPARPEPRRRVTSRAVIAVLALVIVFLAAGLVYVVFFREAAPSLRVSEGAPVSADESADIVKRVSHHMRLSDTEQPTLAVVSDLAPLSGQLFFKYAHVGDVVLMYAAERKAILYDPKADLILEVAPITADVH